MLPVRIFKIKNKTCPTKDLCRVILEPVDNQPIFSFEAGQFIMLHLLDADGNSARARAFSIASAPFESLVDIELGIKSQGELSGGLYEAEINSKFGVQGPYGALNLDKQARNIVYFAGGVGATPVRSHIRESLFTDLKQNLKLFYSGQYLQDLIYHQEFLELSKRFDNFKYIPILTRECPNDWQGECRRLDSEICLKYIDDFSDHDYVMCGPKPFMESVKLILSSQEVDLTKKLRFERY